MAGSFCGRLKMKSYRPVNQENVDLIDLVLEFAGAHIAILMQCYLSIFSEHVQYGKFAEAKPVSWYTLVLCTCIKVNDFP